MNPPNSFIITGTFLGFIGSAHKLKYLRLATPDTELQIKLTKQSRASCPTLLNPSDTLQVFGQAKVDPKTNTLTLKAFHITPRSCASESSPAPATSSKPCPKVKLLLCQKSDCQKKGSKKQQLALEIALREHQLHHQVILQESGCLGKCSQAPNIMLMPGKKRLSGMSPDAIAHLLTKLV